MALRLMPGAEMKLSYDGAKEMIFVDNVDDRQFLCKLVEIMWEELPKKKRGEKEEYTLRTTTDKITLLFYI